MKKQAMRFYEADLETTTGAYSHIETKVWLSYIENFDDEYDNHLDVNLEGLMKFIESKEGPCTIFFHNLNFDIEFVFNYLVDHYRYQRGLPGKKANLKIGEWTSLSDGVSSHYEVRFKTKLGHNMSLRCSYKQLMASVSALQGVFEKEKIDYDIVDLPQNVDEVDVKQKEYIIKDVRSVIPYMKKALQLHGKGIGLTVSGTAMNQFKNMLGREKHKMFFDKCIRAGRIDDNGIYHEGEWDYYKRGLMGGMVGITEGNEFKVHSGVRVLDFNSLYSAIMLNFPLPVGERIPYCKQKNCEHFQYLEINLDFKIKPGRVPFITDKEGYSQTAIYLKEASNHVIYTTNRFWALIQKHYEIPRYKVIKRTCFTEVKGLYDEYISHWQEMKKQAVKGSFEYLTSKLMQNSNFGKTIMTPLRKKYYMRKFNPNTDKGKVDIYGFKTKWVWDWDWDLTSPSHILHGLAIANYARIWEVSLIQKLNKCTHLNDTGAVLYFDTDSVHFSMCTPCWNRLLWDKEIEIDPNKCGALDLEGEELFGYYMGRKFYLEFKDINAPIDPHHCGMAGVNKFDMTKYTNKDIIKNNWVPTKLQRTKVHGGIILEEVEVHKEWMVKN